MGSLRAVSITTGTTLVSRMVRHRLMPSIPGSMTSSSTTSNTPERNDARPAGPSAATSTVKPSRSRESRVISRMVASSSTRSTRGAFICAKAYGRRRAGGALPATCYRIVGC